MALSELEKKENKKIYYQKNKEKIKAARRLYCKNNKDLVKVSKQNDYQKNKEKIIAKVREYRKNNKEKIKEIQKKYNDSPKGIKNHKMGVWRKTGIIDPDLESVYDYSLTQTNCWICNKEYNKDIQMDRRCLDHDHDLIDEPNIRYICCVKCNLHLLK